MHIKLIDLDEHALVVTVTRSGLASVVHPRMCGVAAAETLRDLAEQIEAAHGSTVCAPDAEPEAQQPAVPETLGVGGSFDAGREVWTDGTGHAWDLTVTWGSVGGLRWRWAGGLTEAGVPLMRTGEGAEPQPFDLVWALYGPLFAAAGDRT